jgi:hypothetical protein
MARVAVIAAAALVAACGTSGAPSSPPSGDASPPDAGIAVTPSWGSAVTTPILPQHFGHNTIWSRDGLGLWDPMAAAPRADVLPLVEALHPGALRFPGGTRAMRYHFDEAVGPASQRKPQCDAFTGTTDATTYGLAEFLGLAAEVGAAVTLVAPWADGSPQRAAAMIAYANGDPQSAVSLGKDADGVDWGTAGSWAAKRVQDGHAAPWGVAMLEVGNEPYLDLAVGPATSCGRPGPFKQDERWVSGAWLPTTAADYAGQLAATAALVRAVDSHVRIGAAAYSSYDGVSDAAKEAGDVDRAGSGDPWNGRLVTSARDSFDVFVLHPYDLTLGHTAVGLGGRLEKTVRDLRALAPDKGIAITEFGSLRGGDSVMSVVLTADVVRVAIEGGAEMVLRHVLIEDTSDEPFANAAAIVGPTHTTQAGYEVMQLLATTLSGQAVAVPEPAPDIEAMAARTAGGGLALLLLDRRADAGGATDVRVTLPAGVYHGTLHVLSGDSLDATAVTRADTPVASAMGVLHVSLPPNGVAVLELATP